MSDTGEIVSSPVILAKESLPWQRGLVWLLFLGPFFFLSYGFANWWASRLAIPDAVVFEWEQRIPFVPWTIVPYWSIDLLYGLSFLLCRSRREVDTHALRLLTVQLISIACFILFPLRFSFNRPVVDGSFGWMFDILMGFDMPFNQAPSLHIALLVVLWVRYAAASRGFLRLVTHVWALLIGISVLTTYQHHFVDVPTGALTGLFSLWLWPGESRATLGQWRFPPSPWRCRLGGFYLLGAALCVGISAVGGTTLWLLWPAVSLTLVSIIYLAIGPCGFQKRDGRFETASAWLLAPYVAGAWINSRLWTFRSPVPVHVADGVWLGRLPTRREMQNSGFGSLCSVCAELPVPQGNWTAVSHSWLDLVHPEPEQLAFAAEQIEDLRSRGSVLVCCALGYSRSASAVAAWLLRTGRSSSVDEAVRLIAARRPQTVFGAELRASLQRLASTACAASARMNEPEIT